MRLETYLDRRKNINYFSVRYRYVTSVFAKDAEQNKALHGLFLDDIQKLGLNNCFLTVQTIRPRRGTKL